MAKGLLSKVQHQTLIGLNVILLVVGGGRQSDGGGWDQDRPLSVYIDSVVPLPSSELLEDIYSFCKGIDGFLHLKYSHVSEEAP